MTEPFVIYTTASLFALSALSATRIITLRVLYLVGSSLFFMYGFLVHSEEIVFWNGINVVINLIRIVLYLIEIKPWFMNDTELYLYNAFFKEFMLPGHFRKIIRLAEKKIYKDTTILDINVDNKELFFVLDLNGELLAVTKHFTVMLDKHSFFGEMSFLKEQKTRASVQIIGETVCYHWSKSKLNRLKKAYPSIFSTLILILSHELVKKLDLSLNQAQKT